MTKPRTPFWSATVGRHRTPVWAFLVVAAYCAFGIALMYFSNRA
ncbi:hypothetical protein [Streptomyces durbertensis]|nr:hypothetical protein [Streptomyces durbertensis]